MEEARHEQQTEARSPLPSPPEIWQKPAKSKERRTGRTRNRAFISNCNARSRNAWDPRDASIRQRSSVRVFLVTRFPIARVSCKGLCAGAAWPDASCDSDSTRGNRRSLPLPSEHRNVTLPEKKLFTGKKIVVEQRTSRLKIEDQLI